MSTDSIIALLAGLLVGALVGALVVWLSGRIVATRSAGELEAAQAEVQRLSAEIGEARAVRASLDTERHSNAALAATIAVRDEERHRAAADLLRERQSREEEARRLTDSLAATNASERAIGEQLATLRSTIEAERKASEDKLALLASTESRLSEVFTALATEVMQRNGATFMEMAGGRFGELRAGAAADIDARKTEVEQLVAPLKESLEKLQTVVTGVEKERIGSFATLESQIKTLADGQTRLSAETQNLVKALRAPQVRGQWGELQLRRVVEFAGMERHCDFTEQATVASEDGRLRPDLLVHLPGRKTIVVDSKVALQAYIDALEAPDEATRDAHLVRHAQQLRTHIDQLSAKSYWDQFAQTPDFVILFVPGEAFLSAACQQDPGLYERGFAKGVLLAGPTTLIGLLKTISYGWRQEQIAESAEKLRDLGQELYDRLCKLAEHFAKVGSGLKTAVGAYNSAAGALESRVLVSGRKFMALGVQSPSTLQELEPVEVSVRQLQSPEMAEAVVDLVIEPSRRLSDGEVNE